MCSTLGSPSISLPVSQSFLWKVHLCLGWRSDNKRDARVGGEKQLHLVMSGRQGGCRSVRNHRNIWHVTSLPSGFWWIRSPLYRCSVKIAWTGQTIPLRFLQCCRCKVVFPNGLDKRKTTHSAECIPTSLWFNACFRSGYSTQVLRRRMHVAPFLSDSITRPLWYNDTKSMKPTCIFTFFCILTFLIPRLYDFP